MERKTAENLLQVLEEVVLTIEKEWGATVVAVVMDTSGESWKAHRLFARKYPQIMVLDCYAHQVHYSLPANFLYDHPINQ
jgi:hypothetical protein